MRIVVIGAHPDDAESGAGGLCARAVKAGHEVFIVYFGKGVRGRKVKGIPEEKVRVVEAQAAARILGAQVDSFGYYHGEYPVTVQSTKAMERFLRARKPDIVLTHWPVDTHPDHQVAGILPLRPYIWHQSFGIAFYEVCTGQQTVAFQPNRYVDISGFVTQKRKALLAHRSQHLEAAIKTHETMSRYRGMEIGCAHAEAFYVLGGQARTAFDDLFDDRVVYKDSGGLSTPAYAGIRPIVT